MTNNFYWKPQQRELPAHLHQFARGKREEVDGGGNEEAVWLAVNKPGLHFDISGGRHRKPGRGSGGTERAKSHIVPILTPLLSLPPAYIPRKCCRNASFLLPRGAPFSPPRPFPGDCKSCFCTKPDLRGHALAARFAFRICSIHSWLLGFFAFVIPGSLSMHTRESPSSIRHVSSPVRHQTATPMFIGLPHLCVAETVQVPTMAESITEGTLKTWNKKVGDSVAADEEVATIETDKV